MNKFSTVLKGVEFEEGDLFAFIFSATLIRYLFT